MISDWNKERNKIRLMKKAIIETMLGEGATKEEMIEVTGYSPSALDLVLYEIRQEQKRMQESEEEKHLVRIKREMPNLPKVEYEGKTYIDVTELFMSSEWMAEEER